MKIAAATALLVTGGERLSGPHLKAYDRAIEWARMGALSLDRPRDPLAGAGV
jgi:hypothetical protein